MHDIWSRISKDEKINLTASLVFLLYGIWILYEALNNIVGVGRSGEPGPAFMPRIIGILLIGLSSAIMVRTLLRIKRAVKAAGAETAAPEDKTKSPVKISTMSIVLTFALFVFYSIALRPLGFILTSAIFSFLQMLVLSVKPTIKQIIVYAIISIAASFLLYYLFVNYFYLFLPRGILG